MVPTKLTKYKNWDYTKDYIVTDLKPDPKKSDLEPSLKALVNTINGKCFVDNNNSFIIETFNKTTTFQFENPYRFYFCGENFIFFSARSDNTIITNPYDYEAEYATFLIDSRGIIFRVMPEAFCFVGADVLNQTFLLTGSQTKKVYAIKYHTIDDTESYKRSLRKITFNKACIDFFNRPVTPCIYYRLSPDKVDSRIEFLLSKRNISYEVIPNLFVEDSDNINIAIPITKENYTDETIQYLISKTMHSEFYMGSMGHSVMMAFIEEEHHGFLNPSFNNPLKNEKHDIISTIRLNFGWTLELAEIFLQKVKNKIDSDRNAIEKFIHLEELPFNRLLAPSYVGEEYLTAHLKIINSFIPDTLLTKKELKDWNNWINKYRDAYSNSYDKAKRNISEFESRIAHEMKQCGIPVSKWTTELGYFMLIKKIFVDAIYQYKDGWLGLQSLDIFIPSLNVGIEYQGKQHFEPIEFFGGEEAFEKTQERDKRKFELCKESGVKLFYINYYDSYTNSELIEKIRSL